MILMGQVDTRQLQDWKQQPFNNGCQLLLIHSNELTDFYHCVCCEWMVSIFLVCVMYCFLSFFMTLFEVFSLTG